jgi:hypothetical protein
LISLSNFASSTNLARANSQHNLGNPPAAKKLVARCVEAWQERGATREETQMTALELLEIVIATGMLALMACMAWACLGFSKQR